MSKLQEVLSQFRQTVYQVFEASRDAAFELIDAIASSPNARSAVEVSDSPLMERNYASVYKGLERTKIDEGALRTALVKQADESGELMVAGYAIQALDHTPYPRKDAPTVSDRGYVHGADGNVIGHQYSLLGRVMHERGAWVGIEDCQRIPTESTPTQIGAAQIARLRQTSSLKHIITADCEYLTEPILDQANPRTELLIRLRSNRVFFLPPVEPRPGKRGPKGKHGRKFKLNDARTHGKPLAIYEVHTEDGERIEITVFINLHARSHPDLQGCIIRVRAYLADGTRKFVRPIWLYWTGPHDMDWSTFWKVYLKRFCIESVHQFSKNSLAWTAARLGYTEREERWTWLVMLAYWQLLLAAPFANDSYRPWQKPMPPDRLPTPARVQRDYWRIFLLIGTPALSPKPRGISPGRPLGYRPPPRPHFKVIKKSKNKT